MDFRTPDSRGRYYDPRPTRPAHRPEPTPEPDSEPAKEEEPSAKPKKRVRRARKAGNWKKILITVIVIGVIAWLAYGYVTTKNQLENQKNTPSAQTPTQQTISKVAALVDLPTNESPTLATVSNVDALKKQSKFNETFFADTKNGDILLVYSKNNKAIVYRPSTNKIIASGPYQFTAPQGQ